MTFNLSLFFHTWIVPLWDVVSFVGVVVVGVVAACRIAPLIGHGLVLVVRRVRCEKPYWAPGEFERYWAQETIREMAWSLASAKHKADQRASVVRATMASPTFRAPAQPAPHVVPEPVRRMGDAVYDLNPIGEPVVCPLDREYRRVAAVHGFDEWRAAVQVAPSSTYQTARDTVYASYARFVHGMDQITPAEFWKRMRAAYGPFEDTVYDTQRGTRPGSRPLPRWRNPDRTVPLVIADELPTYDTTGQQLRAAIASVQAAEPAAPVARARKRL
jgi:hypothetical protein